MLKKTIKYTDFNGVEREEDFYFNLTEAELFDMNLSKDGGLQDYIQAIVKSNNSVEISKFFRSVIDKAYGVKSADGKHFEKSERTLAAFKSTQAYSDLYVGFLTNADEAADFMKQIIPAKYQAQLKEVK